MSAKVMGCPAVFDLSPNEMTHSRNLIGIIDKYISCEQKPKAVFINGLAIHIAIKCHQVCNFGKIPLIYTCMKQPFGWDYRAII